MCWMMDGVSGSCEDDDDWSESVSAVSFWVCCPITVVQSGYFFGAV